MTRFKNLINAKRHAFKTRQWLFNDEDGTGFVVVGPQLANELIEAGLKPMLTPFDSIRIR